MADGTEVLGNYSTFSPGGANTSGGVSNIAGGLLSGAGSALTQQAGTGLQSTAQSLYNNSVLQPGAGSNAGIASGYFGGGMWGTNLGPSLNGAASGVQGLANNGSQFAQQFLTNGGAPGVTNAGNYWTSMFGANGGVSGGLQQQFNGLQMAQGNAGTLQNAGINQLTNPLIGQAQQASASNIGQAGKDFNSVYQQQLSSLMQQLQLPQQLQMNANQQGQFSRGQLGTTGGALQTQAMATGFGQADLAAAQQAFQQALGVQNSATANAGVLGTLASNQQLTGANMFGTGANMMNQTGGLINSVGSNLGQLGTQNLNTQFGLATAPTTLAGSSLSSLINPALQGAGNINTMGLQNAQMNLNYGTESANSSGNAAKGLAGLAQSPVSNSVLGNLLSALGGSNSSNGLLGAGSSALNSLFGGSNTNAFQAGDNGQYFDQYGNPTGSDNFNAFNTFLSGDGSS